MYCRQCGKELPDGAQFCPYCGAASNAENAGGQNAARQNGSDNGYAAPPYPPYPPRPYPNPQDIYSGGWIALGFFFPLVGLILYLVWQTELPNRARACGKGALIGVIVQFVFWFILVIVAGVIGASQYAGAAIAGLVLHL